MNTPSTLKSTATYYIVSLSLSLSLYILNMISESYIGIVYVKDKYYECTTSKVYWAKLNGLN